MENIVTDVMKMNQTLTDWSDTDAYHIYGPFLLKIPYYHQNMTLVLDIFFFTNYIFFLYDNGQVYLS